MRSFSCSGRGTRVSGAVVLLAIFSLTAACNSKPSPPQQYQFSGRIVSIDTQSSSAIIDGDEVKGFMPAMAMSYKFKVAGDLNQLKPGNVISADLFVQKNGEQQDYWLENTRFVRRPGECVSTTNGTTCTEPPAAKPQGAMHIPEEGEEVPDFHLVNQDDKKISLDRYRTKVLLITFIYTRCPFPDFCPRITQKFAEVNRQLDADKALGPQTHLISISFDPEHDTPKVLRAYGIQSLGGQPAENFVHWEFATASPKDLPKLADFFGLTIQPDSGLITHSLSTAVIGPDGKIFKWYHGGDWEPAMLVQDATDALHAST